MDTLVFTKDFIIAIPCHVATRFDEENSQHQLAKLVKRNTMIGLCLREERREDINERKLYGELWGIARDITQRAARFCRRDILKKLQDLLTEMQESEHVDNQADENSITNNNSNSHEDEKEKRKQSIN